MGRCPRCGGRAWRVGWFGRSERCRDCGYKYERSPGFSLGAITMNMLATVGLMLPVMVACFVAMSPNIRALPISLALVAIALIVPIAFYPRSYTTWAAIDLSMRPLDPVEEAEAATWVASAAKGTPTLG